MSLDFRASFRPISLNTWTKSMLDSWSDFLLVRFVHVDESGRKTRLNAFIEVLYRYTPVFPRIVDKLSASTGENHRKERSKSIPDRIKPDHNNIY